MKTLAIIVRGKYYPISIFDRLARQRRPKGWSIKYMYFEDIPLKDSADINNHLFSDSVRGKLDKILYGKKIESHKELILLGWKLINKDEPLNYDVVLFIHDDNLIISGEFLNTIIKDKAFDEWDILTNSLSENHIRGSMEFYKLDTIKQLGIQPYPDVDYVNSQITERNLKIGILSPKYRVSALVIEGEKGFIENTHEPNTKSENEGIEFLKDKGILNV